MRVLVACEFSGIVRDAFIEAGHDALSCDLLPSESDRGPHYQGDVRDLLDDGWDLMVAHPPCTYLANSGVRWLYHEHTTVRDRVRWAAMEEAAAFFCVTPAREHSAHRGREPDHAPLRPRADRGRADADDPAVAVRPR